MKNFEESGRYLKDADDCYNRSKKLFEEKDWRGAIQNAQLAIELYAKAIIALFEEPKWTHTPHEQIDKIVKEKYNEIVKKYTEEMITALNQLMEDVIVSGPWHAWAVYGKKIEETPWEWIPAVELCTEEVATDLMKRADRTFNIIKKIFKYFEK